MIFKRYLISFLMMIFIFPICSVFANDSEWNLDGFKIQDIPFVETQQFRMLLDSSGSVYKNYNESGSTNFESYIDRSDSLYTDFGSRLSPSFLYRYCKEKLELNANLSNWINYGRYQQEGFEDSIGVSDTGYSDRQVISDSLSASISSNINMDYFFGSYEIGFTSVIQVAEKINWYDTSQTSSYSYYSDYSEKSEDETYTFDVTQHIHFGWGRIYEGKYAYQAMQIIADLKEAGIISKALTKKSVIQLGEILTHADKTYIFDSRMKTMTALKAVMEYLIAEGCIVKDNLDAFLIIDDTYRHLSFESRDFGLRFNIRAGMILDIDNYESKDYDEQNVLFDTHKNESWNQSYLIGCELIYEHPIARQWQFGMIADLDWVDAGRTDVDEGYGVEWQYLKSDLNTQINYYYNTRWSASLGFVIDTYLDITSQAVLKSIGDRDLLYETRKFYSNQNLSVSINYRLNPNMYFYASIGGGFKIERHFQYRFYENMAADSADFTIDQLNEYVEPAMDTFDYNWSCNFGLTYRLF